MTVLVAYGTKHGSTREVAEAIASTLRELGNDVAVRPAREVDEVAPYDAVVIGGSLYMGRWHPDARRFVKRHHAELASRPVAVFAMGPRTTAKNDVAESRTQLGHALADVSDVEPVATAIFGGVVDPKRLRFPLNRLPATDARDWDAIRHWAVEVANLIDAARGVATP
jgi:menaquinone-dependent protoporphyrinogen oxidase